MMCEAEKDYNVYPEEEKDKDLLHILPLCVSFKIIHKLNRFKVGAERGVHDV